MQKNDMPWPPTYHIRKHRLAKSVKLRARGQDLEITVPMRFNLKEIPSILEMNKDWILKQLASSKIELPAPLPHTIHLQAMDEIWQIQYIATHAKKISLLENPTLGLTLIGAIADKKRCKKILVSWLKRKAGLFLTKAMHEVSKAMQCDYSDLTIRDQKTVWGSCNAKRSINLNYKLILLPKQLMRYVLIHELCHTKELNHSKHFWDWVARFDANWQMHRRLLRETDQHIPAWLRLMD